MLNQRQMNILGWLYSSELPLTSAHLAILSGCSSKTIRNDIKKINDSKTQLGFKIESKRGVGFYLNITNQEKFKMNYNNLYFEKYAKSNISDKKERAHVIVRKILACEHKLSFEDLSEELYVSVTTIKNDFIYVLQILQEFDIFIEEKNGLLEYIGKSHNILMAILYEKKVFDGKRHFYEEKEFEELFDDKLLIRDFVFDFLIKYKNYYDSFDINMDNMLHICDYLILFTNIRSPKYEYDDAYFNHYRKSNSKKIATKLHYELEKKYFVSYGEEDIIFLTILISGLQIRKVSTMKKNYYLNDFEILVNNVIEYVSDKNNLVKMKDDLLLRDNLLVYIYSLVERKKNKIKIGDVQIIYKQRNLLGVELARDTSLYLLENHSLVLDENDILDLATIYYPVSNRYRIENVQKKIIVVSDNNLYWGLNLRERLLRNFSGLIEKANVYELYEIQDFTQEDYDYIFSPYPKKTIEIFNSCIPIFEVSTLFLEEDKRDIFKTLLTYNNVIESFNELFKEEYFENELTLKNKKEVFDYISGLFFEGKDKQNLINSLLLNEELLSYEIGKNTARIKIESSFNLESFLRVLILEEAILWKDRSVKLVVVWNINNSDKHTIFFENGTIPLIIERAFGSTTDVAKVLKEQNFHTVQQIILDNYQTIIDNMSY